MNKPHSVLVIGAGGYVGRHLVESLEQAGVDVVAGTRPSDQPAPGATPIANAAVLDELLAARHFDQIVSLPQLTRDGVDWILDRVDGPRWLVFSSAQLMSKTPAPGTDVARARENLVVERGGVVVAPTMIFGRGGDQNITRIVRQVEATRARIQIGDGSQLVQPVHIDDVLALVHAHRNSDVPPGVYPVGGSEAIPSAELLLMLAEVLGVRTPPLKVPADSLRLASRVAPLVGLRSDQIERLVEHKAVDDTTTRAMFGWEPAPLAHRVEQAVGEALAVPVR